MRFAWAVVLAVTMTAASGKDIWKGVYTSQQAERGAAVYAGACAQCHRDDLSGYSGLRGEKFLDNWREDSLSSLWDRVSKTMPAGAPGSLPQSKYLDVLAFLLQSNEFPAGAEELKAKDVPGIRFQAKEGPQPVPDFALVQTTGCLAKDPDGNWRLRQATDPVRTRNPNASTASELQIRVKQSPGTATFRILDGSSLKIEVHDHRRALLKGFLIRRANDDRLNPTSVEVIGAACPQ